MKKIFLIILLIFMVSCGEDDKTIFAIKFMKTDKYFKELNIDRLGEYPLFIAKKYVLKKAKEKDIIWENDKENRMVKRNCSNCRCNTWRAVLAFQK